MTRIAQDGNYLGRAVALLALAGAALLVARICTGAAYCPAAGGCCSPAVSQPKTPAGR